MMQIPNVNQRTILAAELAAPTIHGLLVALEAMDLESTVTGPKGALDDALGCLRQAEKELKAAATKAAIAEEKAAIAEEKRPTFNPCDHCGSGAGACHDCRISQALKGVLNAA